jgi:uncharacterized membrane protein YdjX (TVP38/TMEM64 family)
VKPGLPTWARVALLFAIVGAAYVGVRFLPLHQWMREVDDWVDTLGPYGPLVFGVIYFGAVVVLVPRSVLTVASGFLFGFWEGALISVGAAAAAAAVSFLLGRYLFRKRVQGWVAVHPKARAIDGAVSSHGWRVVALLRMSPIVHYSLSNYFYGVMSIGFWSFFLAGLAGTLPGTLLAVWIGTASHAGITGPRHAWRWAYLGVGILATVVASIYIARLATRALQRISDDTPRQP